MRSRNVGAGVSAWLAPMLTLLLGVSPGSAQLANGAPVDEIVITATRMESSVRDVARSVSIIDKDRIQLDTQQLGLQEALAGVPGLYLQNGYNFAQDLRISLRGFGARSSFGIRGIRILVDGIPETLPDGQAGVDSIDIGSIQSIEVLRGPAASLYGNAAGGVIAISSELETDMPYLEGRIATGDHGYSQMQLKSAGKFGAANYLVNLSHSALDGYRDHSKARGRVVNSKLSVPLGTADELIFSLNLSDQPKAEDPGAITAAQAAADPTSARERNVQFDGGEALEQQRFGVVYRRSRPAGELRLRTYYTWREFANRLPFVAGGSVDLDRFVHGFGAQYSIAESSAVPLHLSFGVDLDRQDDNRKRFDNDQGQPGALAFAQRERVDSTGIYVQARYQLDAAWAILAGLRHDRIRYDIGDRFLANGDDSGDLEFDQASPSVALNYRMDDGVLFASYSSGFETPTTTELANPDAGGGFNPQLDAQTADNFEIGYRHTGGALYYELAWFTIQLEEELIPFELPEFPGRTFYSNSGSSSRNGIEAALQWEFANGLRIDAAATWSDFNFDDFVDDGGNDFGGNRLPGLPRRFAYLGLSYRSDSGFSGTLEARYSGDLYADNANTTEVSAYSVANFRLAREFAAGRWRIRPYAGINNLFDQSYHGNIRINAFGGRYFEPAPERNFYVGVVLNYRLAH